MVLCFSPGLNGVIRAAVFKAAELGWEVIGFRGGWRGVVNGDYIPLNREIVQDILPLVWVLFAPSHLFPLCDYLVFALFLSACFPCAGCTILKSSRTNPFKIRDGPEKVVRVRC